MMSEFIRVRDPQATHDSIEISKLLALSMAKTHHVKHVSAGRVALTGASFLKVHGTFD